MRCSFVNEDNSGEKLFSVFNSLLFDNCLPVTLSIDLGSTPFSAKHNSYSAQFQDNSKLELLFTRIYSINKD